MRHPGYSTLTQSTDDGKATGFLRSPCQITKLPPPPLGEGLPGSSPRVASADRCVTVATPSTFYLPCHLWGRTAAATSQASRCLGYTPPPPRPTTTLIFRLPPGPGCRSGGAYLPTPLGRGFTPPPRCLLPLGGWPPSSLYANLALLLELGGWPMKFG